MKGKILFLLGILCMIIAPNVYAEEITTIRINGVAEANGNYYGGDYPLYVTSGEPGKYSVTASICNDDDSICNTSDMNYEDYKELKPGKYKIGYGIKVLSGNTIGSKVKWILNGQEINPTECGQTDENSLGCSNFMTVNVKDWTAIVKEFKFETKTDYKLGDSVDSKVTVTSENGKLLTTNVYWFDDKDKAGPTEKSNAVKKFEKKAKYYLAVEVESAEDVLLDFGDKYYLNGKSIDANDTYFGLGDYNYSFVGVYELDLTKTEIVPADTASAEDKAAAEETTKVVDEALEALAKNAAPVGMSKEVANRVKTALEDGLIVSSEVKQEQVKDSNVSEGTKKAIEENTSSSKKVLGVFDISIVLLAENQELGNVTELPKDIHLVLNTRELIASLPAVPTGKIRVFSVLRFHEGKSSILPASLNSDNNLETASNLFSEYVVVYEDIDEVKVTSADTKTSNPKTYDNIISSVILFTISLLGISSLIIMKKGN
jgi:hypothetical protein